MRAQRGEIWQVDLGMVAKMRPALILSVPVEDYERALVTCVPRTKSPRGMRFEVTHKGRGFDAGVFDAQGIFSVPYVKLARRMGVVDGPILAAVETTVKAWLGL